MEKIVIVVEGGRVVTVFAEKPIEVSLIDFDSDTYDEESQRLLADQVDECREKMLEVRC